MKCPYCGQEHPDKARYCMETGRLLLPEKKACQNKECPDYGKPNLPLEARLCPKCGKAIATEDHDLTFTVNGVSFEMVAVKGGTFWMGAQNMDPFVANYDIEAESNEKPSHSVTLGDYYIGRYEVTQELWEAVMGSNPSEFKGSVNPVEWVSWDDCQEFIKELNKLTGKTFRLPTEAEWEYAARGGSKSKGYKYSGSNDINSVAWYYEKHRAVAWYCDNSGTHPVGGKTPNELGLYDMTGNVWEWCQDMYGSYSDDAQTNPQGPSSGSYRVLRGGGWSGHARVCRVSYRGSYTPDYRRYDFGLRLAIAP